MARHVAEFLARPLDADADQGMPAWVAEVAAVLLAGACVLFVAGRDPLSVLCAAAFVLVVLLPHLLGRRRDGDRPTPRWLVVTTNLALLVLVACAGLAIGLVVLPQTVLLPLAGVVALPLVVRVVRRLAPRRARTASTD